MLVMMIEVVMWVVMMCKEEGQNLCWFHFLLCILKKKSWYVVAGSLPILPTCPTDCFSY